MTRRVYPGHAGWEPPRSVAVPAARADARSCLLTGRAPGVRAVERAHGERGVAGASLGAKRREEAELLRARNELARSVNQHYQDARTTAELIDVFDKGLLKQASEALRLAQFSFQQGASSLLEVFDAQRVQRQILLDYAQARHDLSVSLARLEQAVGGEL